MSRYQTFDERDAEILKVRQAERDQVQGPRVGDWVVMEDGTYRRFTHDWGAGIQTTLPGRDESFYFSGEYAIFSGSLDQMIAKASLHDTGFTWPGTMWFFHHNEVKAHNGVHFETPCRVFVYTRAKS